MSEIILAQTLTPAHFPSSLPSRNIKFISFVAFVSALEAWLSAFARSVSKRGLVRSLVACRSVRSVSLVFP